jgi:organic hydroperoxide reductase OsmC/OhrA
MNATMKSPSAPRVQRRTLQSAPVHKYSACCSWKGSTGAGYENYDRAHEAKAPPVLTNLALSGDPAFRGDPVKLNPEQLLVIAASSCQLLSFLAVAARARLNVVEYQDEALAEMPEDDVPVRITRIHLRPRIVVVPKTSETRVRELVGIAHQQCYIANSLKSLITVEPMIEFQGKPTR